MINFKKYLVESEDKNTHLEHVEDEVFNGGIAGTRKALTFLEGLAQMLAGRSKGRVNVTVKWDGAPALVCGINPENGRFFVGTKSVFNKEGKLNYTARDIDKNHGGGLADKLKVALQELPNLGIRGVIQGDFLYTTEDIKTIEIDGEALIAFRPNTITYTVPVNSSLAQKILNSRMGIVFHTSYSGKTIESAKASFGVDSTKFRHVPAVWATDATFRDASGSATLTNEETSQVAALLSKLEEMFNSMNPSVVNGIARDENLRSLIKTYINSQIRGGYGIEGSKKYATGLINFIEAKYEKEINALKTEKGKARKQTALDTLHNIIKSNKAHLIDMFRMSALIAEVKMILLNKLASVKSLGTFLETSDGYKVTAPEGFVAIDHISGSALKLVDRLEFSKANFNAAKSWKK